MANGETVLSKDTAESIIDVAWEKYQAFVDSKPDPTRADALLKCGKDSGSPNTFTCAVKEEYVLPESLVEPVVSYFKSRAAMHHQLGDKVLSARDSKLKLFLQRIGPSFHIHFAMKNGSETLKQLLKLIDKLLE